MAHFLCYLEPLSPHKKDQKYFVRARLPLVKLSGSAHAVHYNFIFHLDVCIMNGKSYTQGQQWYDDCKQICVCDDGVTGHYTCNQR